jgi:hypothetical protein
MAWLDDLLADPTVNPPKEPDGPTVIDYSMGWPIEMKDRKKTATEKMDADLDAFRETRPAMPPPMRPAEAPPGMLNGAPFMNGAFAPGSGPFGSLTSPPPMQPGAPAPALPPPTEVASAPQPPQNPPMEAMAQGGPAKAPQQQQPLNGEVLPPQKGGQPQEEPGLLQRFDAWTQRNPALLLSLAAGFAGAPSIGTGMSRAFGNAPQGMQIDQQQQMQQRQITSAYRALVEAGMPAKQAMAAAMNPDIFKLVGPDYLGTRKSEIKVVKDSLGNERLVAVNPYMSQEELDRRQGGGEGFKQIRAANTAIDHGIELANAIRDLHNFQVMPGFLNKATGMVAEQYSGDYQRALARFDKWRTIYAHELETALTGKSTVSGTREIADQFDRYGSPEKNYGALETSLKGLSERIGEHEAAFNRGMGGKASLNPVHDMVTNRDKLERLVARGAEPEAAAAKRPGGANIVQTTRGPVPWKVVQP